jgi:hypothetical protein
MGNIRSETACSSCRWSHPGTDHNSCPDCGSKVSRFLLIGAEKDKVQVTVKVDEDSVTILGKVGVMTVESERSVPTVKISVKTS